MFSKGLHAGQHPLLNVVWPEVRVQKRLPDKLASVAPLAVRYARNISRLVNTMVMSNFQNVPYQGAFLSWIICQCVETLKQVLFQAQTLQFQNGQEQASRSVPGVRD